VRKEATKQSRFISVEMATLSREGGIARNDNIDVLKMGVTKMTLLKKRKDYLEKNQVRCEVGYHERIHTSKEIAAPRHVRGKRAEGHVEPLKIDYNDGARWVNLGD
jgi:hypothetical protein